MGGILTIDFILPMNNLFIYVVAISAKWKFFISNIALIFGSFTLRFMELL